MEPLWHIELLGALKVTGSAGTLARLRTRKTGSLLAYLAYYSGRCHTRETLAEMFWPYSEPAAARLNLRTELSFLRRHLEPAPVVRGAVLEANSGTVRLKVEAVQTDVMRFEQTLQSADRAVEPAARQSFLRCGVDLYGAGLLPDYYEEWVLPEQERLAENYLKALRQLVALLREAGQREEALAYAHRAVTTNPLCEQAYHDLITLSLAMGRRTEALRWFRQLEQRLWEALGMAPSEATCALLETLRPDSVVSDLPASIGPLSTSKAPAVSASDAADTPNKPFLHTEQLPCSTTRFFGRRKELALLRQTLSNTEADRGHARLVTLTGSGGIGKTRLALEAGRAQSSRQERRIVFVPLADLKPEASVPERIAEVLSLPAAPNTEPLQQVLAVLHAFPTLLILDNFEHLASSAKQTLARLLQVETARFLVTSRHRLGLPGEREIPVLPLQTPAEEENTPEAILASESVQMFLDRARAVQPDFEITATNAQDCAAICRHLDGLPLGIDLVAGWASLLTLTQMAARMEIGETLPSLSVSEVSARHSSLQAAIDWSWQLLDPALRLFWARLVVFRGSWSLEAAEAVSRSGKTLERLAALRERSLILTEEQGGEVRFRLLEPIRAYLEKRVAAREREQAAQRHAAYYLALAEHAERAAWQNSETLRAEQRNFLAALDTLQGREEGLRLVSALGAFWQRTSKLNEAEVQITRMLASCTSAAPVWRARACVAGAIIARLLGRKSEVQERCAEAATLGASLPTESLLVTAMLPLADPILLLLGMDFIDDTGRLESLLRKGRSAQRIRAFLLGIEGRHAYFCGDYAEAEARLKEGLDCYRERGDRLGMAILLYYRGDLAVYRGELEEAHRIWQQCLTLSRSLGFQIGIAKVTLSLGYLARLQHDYPRAAELAQEAIALSRSFGLLSNLAGSLWLLGTVALHRGQYAHATTVLEEGLEICRRQDERGFLADTLHALGMVACNQGQFSRARLLLTEALERRRKDPDQLDIAISLSDLGLVSLAENDYETAERLLQESLELLCALHDHALKARVLGRLGLAACRSGAAARAEPYLRECLKLLFQETNLLGIAEGLEAVAELRICRRRPETAATLSAQAAAIREKIGAPLPPRERLRRNSQEYLLQKTLEPILWERCMQRGRAMTWEQAIACALEEAD